MGWACGIYWENRNACRVVVGKFEGKRLLRRSRRRYKIIFKRTFKGWVGETWAELIWLRIEKFEGKRLLRRSRRRYKIIFKRTFKGWVGESWAGLIWLRIEKSDWRF